MNDLGPDERRYLEALRAEEGPTDDDRARVRAALLARLAATGAGVSAAATAAKVGGGKALGGSVITAFAPWKIGVGLASLALAVGVSTTLLATRPSTNTAFVPPTTSSASTAIGVSNAPTPAPLETTRVEDALDRTTAPSPSVEASARPASATNASKSSKPHASASPPRVDDLDGEMTLLTEAQRFLKQGRPDAALQTLARHASAFPRGTLAVEREGLRAVATCEAKRPEGRTLGTRFLSNNPSSTLAARVRAACAL